MLQMKLWRRWVVAVSLLLTVGLLTACGSSATSRATTKSSSSYDVYSQVKKTKTITWGVKGDTSLFGLVNVKTGKIQGFEIDLAKALTKQMLGKNATAKFVQTTTATKIPLLKNRAIDAVLAAMTITPARAKVVTFSKPYIAAGNSLLVKKGSPIKNVASLKSGKYTVLVVKGTTASENIKAVAPKAKILQFDDYGQAFAALKAGQGQAMSTDNGILAGIAAAHSGYQVVGGKITNAPYGIAVDKGQTAMATHINQAFAQLQKNGTYQRLLKKWFGNIAGFSWKEVEVK